MTSTGFWNLEGYRLILMPYKCWDFLNPIVKWVCPHAQCSVSLHVISISILSFGPGWVKLCFAFTIPLSPKKEWNVRVQYLYSCKTFCYSLWDKAFWFCFIMVKSWALLGKYFPSIKNLEYNHGSVEIPFDPRKAKRAPSILDWNKMSIFLLIYICKLNNLIF